MRSRTRYVRPEEVPKLKSMVANFRRFRRLIGRCVDLSMQIADRQTALCRSAPSKSCQPITENPALSS